MSRSGYSDDCDSRELNLYRSNVDRATKGKRGQALLRNMLAVLDAMPVKELAASVGQDEDGRTCALGAVAVARNADMEQLNRDMENGEHDQLAKLFNVAEPLAREIMYVNDNDWGWQRDATPADRWARVRAWVAEQIVADTTP